MAQGAGLESQDLGGPARAFDAVVGMIQDMGDMLALGISSRLIGETACGALLPGVVSRGLVSGSRRTPFAEVMTACSSRFFNSLTLPG
jgi:hypothetical protein